jgi:phospholipase C
VPITIVSNAYDHGGPLTFKIAGRKSRKMKWKLKSSGNWYDFSVNSGNGYLWRFAGRVETGLHSVSDPAMATEI